MTDNKVKPDPLLSSEDVRLDKPEPKRELREELEDLLGRYGEVMSLTVGHAGSGKDATLMIQALVRAPSAGKERRDLVERRKKPSKPSPFRSKTP